MLQTCTGIKPPVTPKRPASIEYARFTVQAKTYLVNTETQQKLVSFTGKANDFGIITATIACAEKEKQKKQTRDGLDLTILPYKSVRSQIEVRNLKTDKCRVIWLEHG